MTLFAVTFFVSAAVVVAQTAASWQGPTQAPPAGNLPGFIYNGSSLQSGANFNVSGQGTVGSLSVQTGDANFNRSIIVADSICFDSSNPANCRDSWSGLGGGSTTTNNNSSADLWTLAANNQDIYYAEGKVGVWTDNPTAAFEAHTGETGATIGVGGVAIGNGSQPGMIGVMGVAPATANSFGVTGIVIGSGGGAENFGGSLAGTLSEGGQSLRAGVYGYNEGTSEYDKAGFFRGGVHVDGGDFSVYQGKITAWGENSGLTIDDGSICFGGDCGQNGGSGEYIYSEREDGQPGHWSLIFGTNFQNRMVISGDSGDNGTAGNVGIGTMSPSAVFTVKRDGFRNLSFGNNLVFLDGGSLENAGPEGQNKYIDYNAGTVFRGVGPAWATRFTAVDGLGDEGEVVGIYREENSSGDTMVNDDFVSNNAIAVFKNNGRVGIGTNNPQAVFHVSTRAGQLATPLLSIGGTASGATSVAVGYGSNAGGNFSTSIGMGSQAAGYSSLALGIPYGGGAQSSGSGSVAIGVGSAAGNNSLVMGMPIGSGSQASGYGSMAFGMSDASGDNSLAIGLPIGRGAVVSDNGNGSVAIGNALVEVPTSIAVGLPMGYGAEIFSDGNGSGGNVLIGNGRITGGGSGAFGVSDNIINGNWSYSYGVGNTINTSYGFAVGQGLTVSSPSTMAIGGYTNIVFGSYSNQDTNVLIKGNLQVTGAKNFVMDDPRDTSKQIVYSSLEGGESGTYSRGSGQLVNGSATINLPDHFALVTAEKGLTVQVTPTADVAGLYIASKNTKQIVVREIGGGKSNATFDYFVQGVRKGHENDPVIVDKKTGVEFKSIDETSVLPKPIDPAAPASYTAPSPDNGFTAHNQPIVLDNSADNASQSWWQRVVNFFKNLF